MNIRESVQDALAEQINGEFYSSYLYLSMSVYFHDLHLGGFAHWLETQAKEELEHALKIHRYILSRNGTVKLKAVAQPPARWESPIHAFEDVLKHELSVTEKIYALADMAAAEKDHATTIQLQFFITEQIEEESSARAVLERLKMAGTSTQGIVFIDKELAQR